MSDKDDLHAMVDEIVTEAANGTLNALIEVFAGLAQHDLAGEAGTITYAQLIGALRAGLR
jgi:hypothetical protein